jgi:hypothetical protein
VIGICLLVSLLPSMSSVRNIVLCVSGDDEINVLTINIASSYSAEAAGFLLVSSSFYLMYN